MIQYPNLLARIDYEYFYNSFNSTTNERSNPFLSSPWAEFGFSNSVF